ncbi:MAG: tetratricopeptide repeat protein [Balneolia bacterium]|nr:tetratricopeptide repeat protein [Balneolia bacterium]
MISSFKTQGSGLILFTALLIFTGFGTVSAQDRNVPAIPDTSEIQVSESDAAEGRRLFVRGITEYEFENYEEAADLLVQAREKLGRNAGLDFSIAESFFKSGNIIDALYYAESAVEQDEENKWYRITLAEIYQDNGRVSDSINQLEEVLKRYPADLDVLYTIAGIYRQEGDLGQANETLGRILEINGPDLQILFQKYRNYSVMGETVLAMEQLEAMLDLDNDNVAAMQILGQMYAEQNRFERAIELLEQAYSIEPQNEETIITLSDLYIRENRWEEAAELLDRIIRNPGVEPFTKVELTQYMLGRFSRDVNNEQLHDAARGLLYALLEEEPEFGYAHALASEYYSLIQDDENLLLALANTNEFLPENEPAWRQRLQLLLVDERYDEVIEVGAKADRHIPDDAFVLFFVGNAHMLNDEYEKAAEVLGRAASSPASREFRSAIYGTLGDVLSNLENWDEADENYEQALRLNPDNDVVLNNFAYFLSTREIMLDEALEMSERAVEAEPENAAYLDTLGWVHFKLGNYEIAREYIQASIDTGSASAVVLEHMGDVYEKLGDMINAKYWWEKALEKDNSKEHLIEKIES